MGAPAAKQGDSVVGVDTHIVLVPAVTPVPTPMPHPFSGTLTGGLATSVKIAGAAAATQESIADNSPPHIGKAMRLATCLRRKWPSSWASTASSSSASSRESSVSKNTTRFARPRPVK